MSDTITETAPEVAVTNPDIERINEMLIGLPAERIAEVVSFTAYLADRERRHKIFVEETLASDANPERYVFNNSKALITAALESVTADA
ncbi:MAG: hypothetical protein HQK98_06940 [Nitrospirae bacterium]|nr:hypothetical protein [Nitrospirota bacterium]